MNKVRKVDWRRNGLRMFVLFILLCAPTMKVLADEDWIDASQGTISNGVFTATNTAVGATLTINNVSHAYKDLFWHLKMKNQDATTTIKFTFKDKNLSINKFWCNAYYKKKKKVLWATTTVSERVYPAGKNGNVFTKTTNSDGSVTYTCTGKIDNIFLNAVYLNYNVDEEVAANPPTGVEKQYTGYDQIVFKGTNESAYSYATYINSSIKPKYGGTIYFWFRGVNGTSLTSDKGLAIEKGSYDIQWKYNVGSYSSYKFDSFVYSKGGGIMYLKSDHFNEWQSSTFTSRINGLQMTDVVPPTAKDLVYTGEPQTLVTAASSPQGKGMYKLATESAYTEEISTGIDAGTYTVFWYLESTQKAYDNYEASDPVTVRIRKVGIPAWTDPNGNILTYATSGGLPVEQTLVTGGSATGGELWYRVGDEGEWTQNPTASASGSYTVYWYIKGDKNHLDEGSEATPKGSVTATINKAPYDMSGISWSNATFTYDGQPHQNQVTLSNLSGGGLLTATYTCSGPEGQAVDAGTYTVTATFATTATNYAVPDPVSTTLTINPFNLQGAVPVVDNEGKAIADQTYQGAAITQADGAVPTLRLNAGFTIPSSAYGIAYLNNINAGTATATAYANGTDPNYIGSCAVNFIIKKRSVEVSTSDQSITYGDAVSSSKEKAALVGAVDGHALSAVTLKQADNYAVSDTPYPNAIMAENAHIEDASHNDVTDNYDISSPVSRRGSLTITAKAGSGFTISGLKDEYEGDGTTAVIPDGDIAVYDGTTKLTKGTDYTVAYTNNTTAGTATATFTFQGNYTGSKTKDFVIYYITKTYNRTGYSYNYCTYCHPSMTLKAGTGAEVFYCQLINDHKEVQLTKETSNVITAATPVMLRTPSTTDVVKLYATTESPAVSATNDALTGVGTTGAKTAGTVIDPSDKTYIFDGDDFVWAKGGTYTAYRAYIDGSSWGTNSARIKVVYGNDNTTGISDVDGGKGQDDRWYDLQGNRISKPTRKGLYILNGKKVVVK